MVKKNLNSRPLAVRSSHARRRTRAFSRRSDVRRSPPGGLTFRQFLFSSAYGRSRWQLADGPGDRLKLASRRINTRAALLRLPYCLLNSLSFRYFCELDVFE